MQKLGVALEWEMGHPTPHQADDATALLTQHSLTLGNQTEKNDLAAAGTGPAPLTAFDLASRLSYFLWSSMPDDELLTLAGPTVPWNFRVN